jgi:hypothetical protein
MSYY